MVVSVPFEELVNRIRARKQQNQEPYVLFLGQDCAEAAGASLDAISAGITEYMSRSSLSKIWSVWGILKGPSDFNNMIAKLPRERRSALLRPFYARLPVPLFYQDLARLIRAGYFTQIFTTSFDDLLEQALSGPMGLVLGKDYVVISVADSETSTTETASLSPADASTYPPVTIFKLHGDLSRADAVLKAEDIAAAIQSQQHLIKEELAGDLIMIGYAGESEPTEDFLPRVLKSELWWVSEDRRPPQRVLSAGAGRDFQTVTGEAAAPSQFFARLYEGLQRGPVLAVMKAAAPGPGQTAPEALSITDDPSDPDQDEAELLEGQIMRAKRLLVELQRSAPSGKNDPALATQIEYQTRQIAHLQDRYRALKSNRERVLSWADLMVQSVGASTTVEPTTKSFLQGQRDLLHQQFTSPTPDHAVIAAVLSAMTSIGSRLDVVDQKVLRGLSEFAPTTTVV